MPTVLITGITGYLGSNLAIFLRDKGWSIIGVKRSNSPLYRINEFCETVRLYNIDEEEVSNIITDSKPDVIVHTATSYGRNGEDPFELFDTNVRLSIDLLKAANDNSVSLFINCDTSLNKDVSNYSQSKAHFREWLNVIAPCISTSIINLRIEHFYGPNEDGTKFTDYVINSCLANVPEISLTEGKQLRDFIYIDDLIIAVYTIMVYHMKHKTGFIEYQVGSGEAVTIKYFTELVKELTKSSTVLNFGKIPYRKNEPIMCKANIENLQRLGWRPNISLKSGLLKVIESKKA